MEPIDLNSLPVGPGAYTIAEKVNELVAAYNKDKPIIESLKEPIVIKTHRGSREV